MAKKFNGHRCERRNLTDLVLGTGPTGKKRSKPKAKSRPKNFFKPGGPTGGGQDNTRVATPAAPVEYLSDYNMLPQYDPNALPPSGAIVNTFGPVDYALGTMPIGRLAQPFLAPLAPGFSRAKQLLNPTANRRAIVNSLEGTDIAAQDLFSPVRAGLEDARALGWASTKATPTGTAIRNVQRKVAPNSKGPRMEREGTGVLLPESGVTSRPIYNDAYGQAKSALRRGQAEDALFSRRVQDQAQGVVDDMNYLGAEYDMMRDKLLGNIEGMYSTPRGGQVPWKPSQMPQHNPNSSIPRLNHLFEEAQMSGIGVNRYGGPPNLNTGGPTYVGSDKDGDWYEFEGRNFQIPLGSYDMAALQALNPSIDLSFLQLVGPLAAQERGARESGQLSTPAEAVITPSNPTQFDMGQLYPQMPQVGQSGADTDFSGTPLTLDNYGAAMQSFGNPNAAPVQFGQEVQNATDTFSRMAMEQHGSISNRPLSPGFNYTGMPFAAPQGDGGPYNRLAPEMTMPESPMAQVAAGNPYLPGGSMFTETGANFGNPVATQPAFDPTTYSPTMVQGQQAGVMSDNMLGIGNPVGASASAATPAATTATAATTPANTVTTPAATGMPNFAQNMQQFQQTIEGMKQQAGFGTGTGDPSFLAQLGSQEGRANIANTLTKSGQGLDKKGVSLVNQMAGKIGDKMKGDDGDFGKFAGNALKAGVGALTLGIPGALPIAAVAGLAGVIKNRRDMMRENRQDIQQNRATAAAMQGSLGDYSDQVNQVMNARGAGYMPTANYGGATPGGMADYETEGGEMMMANPNDPPMSQGQGQYKQVGQNMYDIQGPKHEQGGVPTQGAMEPYIDAFGQYHDSPYVFSDAKDMRIDASKYLKMIS